MPWLKSRRKFGFAAMIAFASSSASGAITTSVKIWVISSASLPSKVRFSAIIPPKAETGSDAKAAFQTSVRSSPLATPQGLACLMIAIEGASNSETSSKAASVSLILLKLSGFPCTCSAPRTDFLSCRDCIL